MADTDPRSDDTLAKALGVALLEIASARCANCLRLGAEHDWDCAFGVTNPDRAQRTAELAAAHPAMQARDAALVQQGRDEVAAAVEALFTGDCHQCSGTGEQCAGEGFRLRDATEPVQQETCQLCSGAGYVEYLAIQPHRIRAALRACGVPRPWYPWQPSTAVAAAGASNLAAIRAEAWDEGYHRGVRDEAFEMERADNPYRATEAGSA